jgi:hypothetical protein
MVGSFYEPGAGRGVCAFEELISFHGGLGGPQTRAVHPPSGRPTASGEPIVGAAAVHGVLVGCGGMLAGTGAGQAPTASEPASPALT